MAESLQQLHTRSHIRSQWAAMNGMESFDFDGMASMTFKSFEGFKAAFEDPYYIHVIEIDERRFLDKSKSVLPSSTMGLTKNIIMGAEIQIGIVEEVMKEWKDWEEKGKTGSKDTGGFEVRME
jgi:hypothetical protein